MDIPCRKWQSGLLVQATALLALVAGGLAIYMVTAEALGAVEFKPLFKRVLGR